MKKLSLAFVLASSFSAALFAGESLMLPVGEKATRCDWELIPYETVDGMKGKFAHISPYAKTNSRVEVPLNVKGRYRIWLGVVVKRWNGYVLHVKLGKEKYPVRMHADFKVDDIPPENPMMGELEFTVADLDNDMLIVRNATGSPGGFAYVRLEKADGEKLLKRPKSGALMVATNDSYWNYSDRDEYFSSFRQLADSPIGRIMFCAVTGENSFPVKTRCGTNEKFDPTVPYMREVDIKISKACERLAAENPNLLKETVSYIHSLDMEAYAYFRPGAAVDFRAFWGKNGDATRRSGKCLYAPENRCRLWDGTIVGRPSYAREEVRRYVLALCSEMMECGFDGINFAFTRALPMTLFEDAFRERFKKEYGEEIKSKDDKRAVDLRCKITGEFLAEVKKLLGDKKLSLTVLGSVQRNREYGLDVKALASAGIVDEFIVDGEDFRMPRKITMDKMDLTSFRKAVEGTKSVVRPQFTTWWNGFDTKNFKKAAEIGCAPACLWDAAHMQWTDWERIRRFDGKDFSAAERWEKAHPDSSRVKRLKTVNNFDILEYPWWMAF